MWRLCPTIQSRCDSRHITSHSLAKQIVVCYNIIHISYLIIYFSQSVIYFFQSVTTVKNDNEMETNSVIPESGDKCSRHYLFSDDECIVVSIS